MRIDYGYRAQATTESNRSSGPGATANALGGPTAGDSSDSLGEDWELGQSQLSGAHPQVLSLAAKAAQLQEVREERVQALRYAIETGQYRPSHEQVAGAVLAHPDRQASRFTHSRLEPLRLERTGTGD